MFFKVMFTVVALGFAALIAWLSRTAVDIRILSTDISVPVAVMVCCFLILGFGIGMLWRKMPEGSRSDNRGNVPANQVPIIANLKVCK